MTEVETSDSLIYPSKWGGDISKFPELPGLQQDPHHGVCVSVCLYLDWSDLELSILSYLIALKIGLTRSYWPVD